MLFVLTSAFTLGVAYATVQSVALSTVTWISLLGLLVAVVWRRGGKTSAPSYLVPVALFFIALAFGLLRTEIHKEQFVDSLLDSQVGTETVFSGTVVREPDQREKNTHLYVETGEEIVLVMVDRHSKIEYGDEILVSGELRVPESFETDLGRTFNYPGYLLARGVTHSVSFAEVLVLSTGNGNQIITFLLKQKQYLMSGIEAAIPEPQAGLAEGLLLGVKQALGESIENDFRKSGLIHIVVLSGYNVMLVVAFFTFILSRLFSRKPRMVIALLGIIAFALIVGLSATVVRACIMASLFLFADTFAKRYDVLRALFFAGFVMILINPFLLLYDIGFQLSFMATLGLILIAPHFENGLLSGKVFGAKEYLVATVATQIAVLPLLLYHIGEISLVAVVVNVLVLPVVALAMLGAFITGLIALVSTTLAIPFAYVTTLVLSYILLIARWFADLPLATIQSPAFRPIWIVVMYGLLAGVLFWLQRRVGTSSATIADTAEEIVHKQKDVEAIASTSKNETPIFFR